MTNYYSNLTDNILINSSAQYKKSINSDWFLTGLF